MSLPTLELCCFLHERNHLQVYCCQFRLFASRITPTERRSRSGSPLFAGQVRSG